MRSLIMLAVALGGLASAALHAQTYPSRPLRIIVPSSPGGGSDYVGRIMALRLEEMFQLIGQDLEQAGALDYLCAGVFICGGGAHIPQIAKLAEQVLQMPVSLGKTNSISRLKSALDQPEFATAIGLVKFGSFQQRKRATKLSLTEGIKSTIGQFFRRG